MNKNKKALLIGLCLGDGSLTKPDKWNSVSISIEHAIKQKELIEYKRDLVKSLTKAKEINIVERKRERAGVIHTSLNFKKGYKYFRIIRQMLYKNNVKTFSTKILNKLNDQAVAIWIMDDGSLTLRKKKDGTPSHCQFKLAMCTTKEQCEIVQKFFLNRYNVNMYICKHGIKKYTDIQLYSLLCGTKEYYKLAKVIDKYMIPSMKYKTQLLQLQECRATQAVDDIC
jgi:hypothetical protein